MSDSHNLHNNISVPDGDIILHAGDATMLGTEDELESFVRWLGSQPHKHKIWVAGNHDWGMESDQMAYQKFFLRRRMPIGDVNSIRQHIEKLCLDLGVTYLNNSGTTIEGLNFWGSPDQPEFCNWAFNRSVQTLPNHWKTIPDNTNVLITHCPAYGILDQLEDGTMVGDVALMKRINTLPNLKIHLCGHIHPGYGTLELGNVTHINGSILDDSYKIRNKPIEVTL
jgi:3',5'-cyclic AMP phosphodiesterase CpdA